MHTKRCFCSKHKRTDVKRSIRLRWNPICFLLYQCSDCFYKHVLWECRHTKSCVGIDHTSCVHFRTEQLDLALSGTICLQAFKCLLCIVQCHTCRIQFDRSLWYDSSIVPSLILVPVHDKHIVCHVLTKSKMFLIWLFL